jgi:hypothetical protein
MRNPKNRRSGLQTACEYIFMYDGLDGQDEVVSDLSGVLEMPLQDQVLIRKDESWRVAEISTQETRVPTGSLAVHRILLRRTNANTLSVNRR